MISVLVVGIGGFVGAVCRYLIGLIPVNETFVFPIKTFVINVVGCILIGIIAAATSKSTSWNPYVVLFLKVGVCGGFTTFSTLKIHIVSPLL